MTCWSARRRTGEYADGRLRGTERSRLERHLSQCPSCSDRLEDVRSMRLALDGLPEPLPPAELRTSLEVTASRERDAIIQRQGSRLKCMLNNWRLRVDAIMRPLTIPAAGGVLSTLLLFSALAFTVERTSQMTSYEVPVTYADRTDANLVPLELRSSVMVTLSLDGHGHITDYSVQDGSASYTGNASLLQGSEIPMPQFPSVLALAQPISTDVSIVFRPIFFRP